MGIKRFEDIIAWQKAHELAKSVYVQFANSRDFGFRDQLQRAAVSIMNNIAEGFERDGDREMRRFLFIAKGSAGEVRSMMYLAESLGYMDSPACRACSAQAEEISRMLAGFIRNSDSAIE